MEYHTPKKPSQEFLDHILENYTYDRDKGTVYNTRKGKPPLAGDNNGYLRLGITVGSEKRFIRSHHMVWFFEYGEWPSSCMDHIDGDKNNNHYTNLRLVSNRENLQYHYTSRAGTSDYVGVSWYKRTNSWRAQVWREGQNSLLGYYKCEKEAARAYDKALVSLGLSPVNAEIIRKEEDNND